jgi:EPS-associated MarR family transcriptional regulator
MSDSDVSTRKTEEFLVMLRELDGSPSVSQRELSARLGISLGKVNFLLRALIEKGFVKVDNFKKSECKSAYLYYLTPRGIEEKTKLTYHFLRRKIKEYERLEMEIRRLTKEVNLTSVPLEEEDLE